ncbi:TlpA family protein disulfide reductase [Aurantimonas coralicida]|nr:TlpA family protein disulfide reductase [Aurantimonas coralicida]
MAALTLGPLVFAGDRLAAIVAIVVFLGVAAILTGRVDERLGNWSLTVVPIGIIAARLGHVVLHWETFAPEPLRVFSIWEGGFAGLTGLAVALLYTLYVFRDVRLRVWSIGALAGAFVAWNIAWQLVASTKAIAAPSESFAMLDGPDRSLADFGARPIVLNLWASWCPPCRREMPMMATMAANRADAVFVFANQGESAQTVSRFLAGADLEIDHIVLDQGYALAQHYGVSGYPATLFLDATGTLRSLHFGEISRAHAPDRRHVSEAPVVGTNALGRGDQECLVAMVVRLVDPMDQRRPLFGAAGVLPVTGSTVRGEEFLSTLRPDGELRNCHGHDMRVGWRSLGQGPPDKEHADCERAGDGRDGRFRCPHRRLLMSRRTRSSCRRRHAPACGSGAAISPDCRR